MRSFWPIFKRELFSFFVTPLAWVLITVFLTATTGGICLTYGPGS